MMSMSAEEEEHQRLQSHATGPLSRFVAEVVGNKGETPSRADDVGGKESAFGIRHVSRYRKKESWRPRR